MTDAVRRMRHYGHRKIAGVRVDFALGILAGVALTLIAGRAMAQSDAASVLEKAGALEPAFNVLLRFLGWLATGLVAIAAGAAAALWRIAVWAQKEVKAFIKKVDDMADTLDKVATKVSSMETQASQKHARLDALELEVSHIRGHLEATAAPTPRPAETQEVRAPTSIRRHTGG